MIRRLRRLTFIARSIGDINLEVKLLFDYSLFPIVVFVQFSGASKATPPIASKRAPLLAKTVVQGQRLLYDVRVGTIPPPEPTTAAHYRLRCVGTDAVYDDVPSGDLGRLPLTDPSGESTALLRTEYDNREFTVGPVEEGLFRFKSWLPVKTTFPGSAAPISYHGSGFGRALGLERLQVVFNGYWPERGGAMRTGTFKETEAYTVFARRGTSTGQHLVIASAGNTARAFLHVASRFDLPVVVVVPEANLPAIWTPELRSPRTVVVAAGDGADYADAIALASFLTESDAFEPEGGARNVGRRDGMGTTYLAGVHALGDIPDHYVQAVGSGTGAIAAWEANLRLLASGPFDRRKSRLHLAQNAPFQVMVDSWRKQSRRLVDLTEHQAKAYVAEIGAKVLANRTPPYGVEGGLFDALSDTQGTMYAVSNAQARAAGALFAETEGIDVSPAAAVACGALIQAVDRGEIDRSDSVLLNITGGGWDLIRNQGTIHPVIPDIVAPRPMWNAVDITATVEDHIASVGSGQ